MPKKLALKKLPRQRRTIYGNKRHFGPLTGMMDFSCDHFLTGPGFTCDHHTTVPMGNGFKGFQKSGEKLGGSYKIWPSRALALRITNGT
jgi:hypothetical protein